MTGLIGPRSGRWLLRLLLLVPLAVGADSATLERLAELMQGRYDSHPPGIETNVPDAERLVDSRQRADAPALGDVVFYLQLNRGADRTLYRQRILVFTEKNGEIEQAAYTLKDAERFVDAEVGDPVLSGLTLDDVAPMFGDGCGQIWTADGDAFVGYVNPATCRIVSTRTGKPRRIEANSLLLVDGLSVSERGYDDDMNQLFGSPPGEATTLIRID